MSKNGLKSVRALLTGAIIVMLVIACGEPAEGRNILSWFFWELADIAAIALSARWWAKLSERIGDADDETI